MRATVCVADNFNIPSAPRFVSQVELKHILVLFASSILNICLVYVCAFCIICSLLSGGRVTFLPVGSPIMPVKSPIKKDIL